MNPGDEDFRRQAEVAAFDLGTSDRAAVLEAVDEMLAERREDEVLPPAADYVAEVRRSLGLPPRPGNAGGRLHAWVRRRWLPVVVVLATVAGLTCWLNTDAYVSLNAWGVESDGLPLHRVEAPHSDDSATLLGCRTGGVVTVSFNLSSDTAVQLQDIQVNPLDWIWRDNGDPVRRISASVNLHDAPGGVPSNAPVAGFKLEGMREYNLVLAYRFDRCPEELSQGDDYDDMSLMSTNLKVTYRLLGRTHTIELDPPERLSLLVCPGQADGARLSC